MTCGETREYLFAFLDSELDAPLSIELQRHLDGCPNCAREAEIERTVRKRMGVMLETGGSDVPALDSSWRMRSGSEQMLVGIGRLRWVRTVYRPRILATAVAVALLVGAGVWMVGQQDLTDTGEASLTDLLVADFEHFLEEGGVVQLDSADREMVTEWLQAKTAVAVVLPALADRGCYLVGGRKCKIAGKPAAFAVYDLDGKLASLVALAADGVDLGGMRLVEGEDDAHWVDQREGYTIVACRRDGLVYAAVSRLPEERLLCLMSGAVHESD